MRYAPLKTRFFAQNIPEPNSGCWLWTGANDGHRGYGRLKLGKRKISSHRYSYEIHKGPIGDGLCVLHACDNPYCVNPDHLFVGTQQDNVDDKVRKNRQAKGLTSHAAKLSEAQVLEIRKDKRTHRACAAAFGVSKTTVRRIKSRAIWQHLE